MARNYYLILGVDPDATQDQIKSAYRRKAKQSHPDVRQGSCELFRDVQDAYETLSDPARRRIYDDELAREARLQFPPQGMRTESLRSRHCPVEPLIPTEQSSGLTGIPFDRWSSPSLAESIERLWHVLGSLDSPWIESTEDIQVSVSLTHEQALRGGRVRVWVPIQAECPSCQGYGGVGFYMCRACSGEGTVITERPVWISFPAGVFDHSAARVSLAQLGAPNTYLMLHFSVRG